MRKPAATESHIVNTVLSLILLASFGLRLEELKGTLQVILAATTFCGAVFLQSRNHLGKRYWVYCENLQAMTRKMRGILVRARLSFNG